MTKKTLRLFFALPLPREAAESLDRAVKKIRFSWNADSALRWIPEQNRHVTLSFLGNVEAGGLPELAEVLTTWTSCNGILEAVWEDLGTFGPSGAPRVVWTGLTFSPPSLAAVRSWRRGLEARGFTGDTKPWRPHVSLAYVRRPGEWRLPANPEMNFENESVRFSSVLLLESRPARGGSIYITLEKGCMIP